MNSEKAETGIAAGAAASTSFSRDVCILIYRGSANFTPDFVGGRFHRGGVCIHEASGLAGER